MPSNSASASPSRSRAGALAIATISSGWSGWRRGWRRRVSGPATGSPSSRATISNSPISTALWLCSAGSSPPGSCGVSARNSLEFADLYGAVAWLGAILLPVNWRLNVEEVAYILGDGAPTLLIADAQEQARIAAISASLPFVGGYYGIGGHILLF